MFRTQAEMDRNAKKWLAILLIGLVGFVTVTLFSVAVMTGGDDLVVSIAKTFSGK